ncbi:MAG: phosphoribosylformimino-5-aminoimidazole carboxamide ribotide isomerase [Lachnospiraceae bacterium]|nr:phosphoribosylformimino-5-aminoimidazole carboxamide ribotide isomerase [Lachnospiraceae bacterium]
MKFRPCIDLHNGRVRQIVGSSLTEGGEAGTVNFTAAQDAAFFARAFAGQNLSGGHIIILNPVTHPYYEATRDEAVKALKEAPGRWQIGGGITPENAAFFLDAGASHVIVTSYVFRNGRIDLPRLEKMKESVGKGHLVLDLSCRFRGGRYLVVTDRWSHDTTTEVKEETLDMLSAYCDEFLIHATDVEGKQEGIELPLVSTLGAWGRRPLTYAGGIRDLADIEMLRDAGRGALDFTVGSALDLYGGTLSLAEILSVCDG